MYLRTIALLLFMLVYEQPYKAMDVWNRASVISNCSDSKLCSCFDHLNTKRSNFESPLEYFNQTSRCVDEHLDLIYKHQFTDTTRGTQTFAFVKARVLKKAIDHQIETLKYLEKILRDS